MPETSRATALRRVYQDARAAGLDDEGARVAAAVAATEHGYEGALGDNGQSAGTFQLYAGGQLPAYAASAGIGVEEAKRRLQRDPHAANDWALSTYLGDAIRRGQAAGLHGADLATYAQRTGQVSVSPERAGANYRTIADETVGPTGGNGVDTSGDRPPSSFEPPSRYGGSPGTAGSSGRAGRMQGRITDLQQRRADLRAKVDRLLAPGADETPTPDDVGDVSSAEKARVDAARANRTAALTDARAELGQVETALRQVETDVANDPDPKDTTKDPMQAERDRIAVETAAFNLSEAKRKAAVAADPMEKRLAELEVQKAELGVEQARLSLERTRNPLAPQRAPRYPDEIAQSEAAAAASRASAARTTALTPLEVAKSEQEIAKGRQDLLPKQQQILQAHQDTIQYLRGMYERGEIDMGQMNAYVTLSKQAMDSALQGTTPFEEMNTRRTAEQARQKMGVDLLNQRLSSGTSLASSLLSSATSLAGHAMLQPGQTSLGVDPLAQLMPLLAQLQGGQDVTGLARGMLQGGQTAPAPAGPLPAGL